MIQNFHLFDYRTQVPVTSLQYVPNFFTDDDIKGILNVAKQFEYQNGDILGQDNQTNIVVRQSIIKWLEWTDSNWWMYEKINDHINELNNHIWDFDVFGINEYLQYTEYQGSQKGHYDWHVDVSHEGLASNRKLTFECMLEDDYTGGEFSVLLGPTEHKFRLQKGDAVVFPSFLINKVHPVESGTRKSLTGWISGPSFR